MTIVDKFRALVAKEPEALAFRFLADDESVAGSLTRGELDARARAVAAELVARGLRGERVVLLYAPGLDFIVALFGCLYAGAVAVPAYPPDPARLARALPRLQAIAADCQPALVLTTAAFSMMAPHVADLAPDLARAPWAGSDEWAMRDEAGMTTPPRASDLAFLQYTSGSTATPKGVLIGHDTLAANLGQLGMRRTDSEVPHVVSWLPFYHDMGLICGILLAAFIGGSATLMSPIDFLKRPVSWLRAMHRYQGWLSPAPPFALELCVRKVTPEDLVGFDFSHWKAAIVGAEPIRRPTLERFAALLAPFGFHPNAVGPAYGLAESVVAATAPNTDAPYVWGNFDAAALQQGRAVQVADHAENAPKSRVLVGCGTALPEEHFEIVDPATRVPVGAGRVGEIWIAGPNVARGYFRREAESAEVFGGRLAEVPPNAADVSYLRTGDLGFLLDGELYVTGRLKDLIILRGKNHHPQDIEHTVENAHPFVRPGGCAAFAILPGDGGEGEGERLAVAAEIDARSLPDASTEAGATRRAVLAEISASIRSEVSGQHAIRVHTLVLLKPGQLPKTSSGKVMRRGCRDDLAAGRLTELDRSVAPGEGDLEGLLESPETAAAGAAVDAAIVDRTALGFVAWLTPWIARRLRIAVGTLTPMLPFAQLGVDSLEAVALSAELARAVGHELPATVFLECTNVAELAEYLSFQRPVSTSSCVVPLAVGGADRPLVLIPGIFGMLSAFSQLVTELRGLMPLWALDLPLHHGLATPPSIDALAALYVDQLLAMPGAASAEPFRLAGYCSGGMIAVEVGRQLQERARSVERVLLLDAPYLDGEHVDSTMLLAKGALLGKGITASSPEDALRQVVRYAVEKNWTFGQGEDFIDRMVAGGVANLTTFQHWVPRPVAIPTSLFSAEERADFPLYEKDASVTAARWTSFLGRAPAHVVIPGHHHSMLQPPHVAELARVLVRELSRPNEPR